MAGNDDVGREPWTAPLAVARSQLFAAFFFAAFIFLLYQLYQVFAAFLGPILWAVILAMLFYPVHLRIVTLLRNRATATALLSTLLVIVAIVGPTLSLSSVVTREAASLYEQVTEWVRSGRINETVAQLRSSRLGNLAQRLGRTGIEVDYAQLVQRIADLISTHATALARNIALFFFDFLIMLFTLFFLFRDGERLYRGMRDVIPMDPVHKDTILRRLYETLTAVVRGMVVTAIVQGLLSWLGFLVLGLPYAAFLGVMAGLVSLVPAVGAAGVWIPCAVYLALIGEGVRALLLVGYGTVVISMVDNFLRPLLIGGQTRLPTLFLFFGMLGGVQVYGFLGLFFGPVLLAVVVAFVKIFKDQYVVIEPERQLPPASGS